MLVIKSAIFSLLLMTGFFVGMVAILEKMSVRYTEPVQSSFDVEVVNRASSDVKTLYTGNTGVTGQVQVTGGIDILRQGGNLNVR